MRQLERFDRRLSPISKLALAIETVGHYVWVRLRLRHRPLPVVVAELRHPRGPRLAAPDHPAVPYRLALVVTRVLSRLPSDSRCLISSLVLLGLLERRSVTTQLVIGVRGGSDFGAHAWVELEGQPLLSPQAADYRRITAV